MLKVLLAIMSPVSLLMSSHRSGSLIISYLSQRAEKYLSQTAQLVCFQTDRQSKTEEFRIQKILLLFRCCSIPQLRIVRVKGNITFQQCARGHRLGGHDLYGVLSEMRGFILIHNGHHHGSGAPWEVGSLVAERICVFHCQSQDVLLPCFKIQRLCNQNRAEKKKNNKVTLEAA